LATCSERESLTLHHANGRQLLHDERVSFAAYRVPHPLEHNFVLRVQTEDGYEPKDAVINAANVLLVQLTSLRSNFEQEWELKKLSGDGDVEY
jgi:DNA-directed RNA polymerase II subunit RPB11